MSQTMETRAALHALPGSELLPLRQLDIALIALAEPQDPNAPAPTPASDSVKPPARSATAGDGQRSLFSA